MDGERMQCPECSVEQLSDNRFCEDCGASLVGTSSATIAVADGKPAAGSCPHCGAGGDAFDSSGFCLRCGFDGRLSWRITWRCRYRLIWLA